MLAARHWSTLKSARRLEWVPLGKVDIFTCAILILCSEVVKARHIGNNKQVALKKIFIRTEQEGFPITSLREIKLLKNVNHPNVVNLVDMAVSYKPSTSATDAPEVDDIFMVFPYMDHDLVGLLENRKVRIDVPIIKCYFQQVLQGLDYLHKVL